MYYRPRRRRGLTLLEVVLTFAITMLILLALVMIMHAQFSNAQAGRDAITEATVARSIFTRVSADIVNSLGPVDPRFLSSSILPNNANQSAAKLTGAAASSATPTTGAAASPSPSSTTNSSSTGSMTPAPFNLGVKGDARWLLLSVNRTPGALLVSPKTPVTDDSIPSSDLRSLSYWLVDGKGLARIEMEAVTSDTVPTDQPSFDNPQQYVFAKEVADILFEYYDGATWQSSWDGGALGGNDGNTPVGPPSAIRITIWLRSGVAVDGGAPPTVSYKQVVALPASNAFTQSGPGQTSGQFLVPALQAGQPIPAANSSSTTTGGTGM